MILKPLFAGRHLGPESVWRSSGFRRYEEWQYEACAAAARSDWQF
jgi:hypothetical protein